MPMGMADCAGILFREVLRFDPQHPEWHDRDRFVLSAGHGSMLLYALLYLCGVRGVSLEALKTFRQLNSAAAGHPEYRALPAIETTTGPLGQGIANAVGFAIAERKRNAQFGDDLANHRTWVVAGDGCLMEGISHESIALAGHLNLHKLCILFDDNNITIDGKRSLSDETDQQLRFQACGWKTLAIDGHDETQIRAALAEAQGADKPTLVCCRTHIGYGADKKTDSAEAHGAPLGEEEIKALRRNLRWDAEPFVVPPEMLATWRKLARHAESERDGWQRRFDRLSTERQGQFLERAQRTPDVQNRARHDVLAPLQRLKRQWLKDNPALASRQSSLKVIEVLASSLPEQILGGSADLSGSNGSKAESLSVFDRNNYNGSYIHYGIREHAMTAVMNGIALHSNFLVYGGTFLVFSDYARPAIRLAALMSVPIVLILTHDSIALGEDGPTHQPIEQLAALRAIPNLFLFRPCDSVEVLECWQAALALDAPSALVLTRQSLPAVRNGEGCVGEENNLSRKGGYIVRPAAENAVRLIASGSEVHLAICAAALLREKGVETAVVSMPSWELFEQQSEDYREQVLGANTRIAIEAASSFGWERYATSSRHIIAIDRFGASAPGDLLMKKFGFTAEAVAEKVEKMLR